MSLKGFGTITSSGDDVNFLDGCAEALKLLPLAVGIEYTAGEDATVR